MPTRTTFGLIAGFALSFIVGLVTSLTVYNLVQIGNYAAPVSRELLLVAGLAGVAGALAYYSLFKRLIVPAWGGITPRQQISIALVGLVLGLYLLVTTTLLEVAPSTISLIAPSQVQTLEIRVPVSQSSANVNITLYYLNTGAGPVIFDDVTYQGWTKTTASAGLRQSGAWLVLDDLADNHFKWTGVTGGSAQLAFARSSQGGVVDVSWNGVTERIDLSFHREARFFYNTEFSISRLPSQKIAWAISALAFSAWMFPLVLYVWSNRSELQRSFTKEILPSPGRVKRKQTLPTLVLIALMLLALLPRVLFLGREIITIDEPLHLVAAKELISGAPLDSVYQRSLYMVTLPVALFTNVFGTQLWAARLPGALMNALAVIPLFLIMNKVSRGAAVITCLLFAFNPWVIGMARYVREYAYYPFFFFWIVLGMIAMIERIPDRFVVARSWKAIAHWRFVALGLALLVPAIYVFFFDQSSTFKIVGFAYVVFLFFMLNKFDLSDEANRWLIAVMGLALVIFVAFYLSKVSAFSITPDLTITPLRLFFPSPAQQIYFERPALLFAFALVVSSVLSLFLARHNFIPAFLLGLLLVSLFGFTLFWDYADRTRYYFTLQLWFIPLLGIGLYELWRLARKAIVARPVLAWAVIILLLAISVNPLQALAAADVQSGLEPVTEQYLYNMGPIEALMLAEANEGELLISNTYGPYAQWKRTKNFQVVSPPSSLPGEFQQVFPSYLEAHDSGWIVLDAPREWTDLARSAVEIDSKTLEYLGEIGFQLVWRWSPSR